MLGIGDNFDYQGKKPNFARDCFSTLEKMKSYPETSIDPGHISFCGEDGKLYQYLPDNEINEVTGKWRRLVDSILDANSENPIQNKVVVKKISDLEKLIAGSAEKVKGDIDLDIETMGGIIAAGMVDLNRNMDELEEAVSEALNSLNAGHVSLEEIKVNGHPITSSVNLNSTDIGLGNVDNTRDLDKPISTRVSAALNEKVDKSIRVNNKSLAQDVVIEKSDIGLGRVDNTGDMEKPVSNAVQQALDDKVSKVPGKDLVEDADIAKLKRLYTKEEFDELVKTVLQTLKTVGETHTGRKDNPHNVTKDQVGLGSVDDTSDLDKPISRAVQAALNQKVGYERLQEVSNTAWRAIGLCEKLEREVDKITPISNILSNLAVQQNSYGVEIDFSEPIIKYTPLGNPELHKTLPVQNKIRPCILNDEGKVVKYLPVDSGWSDLDVDGRLGQVMVEIPEFWYYMENQTTKMVIKISDIEVPGFSKRPKSYISAYNATVDRNLVTEDGVSEHVRRGLCSVCSNDPRYKGGPLNNKKWNESVQGYSDSNSRTESNYFKQTLLGKPTWGDYLYKRNSRAGRNTILGLTTSDQWHTLDYPMYLTIFFLYVIEFKNIDLVGSLSGSNDQDSFVKNNSEYNSMSSAVSDYQLRYSYSSVTPRYIGESNSIGGGSGAVKKTLDNGKAYLSIRYRGIENLVGDLPYNIIGLNFKDYSSINTVGFSYFSPDMKRNSRNLTRGYSYARRSTNRDPIDLRNTTEIPCFIESLEHGVIGSASFYKTEEHTSTTYFRTSIDFFGSYISSADKLTMIFGQFNEVYNDRGSSFNTTNRCKANYLTQVLMNSSSNYELVSLGTRLCYYPPESLPTEEL
jgi:hypothetical protein